MRLYHVRYYLFPAVLLFGLSLDSRADLQVTKVGDSVVDAKALTIQGGFGQCINGLAFQQDAVVTHLDHQYVAYNDAETDTWIDTRQIDSRAGLFQDAMGKSARRCSYPNGYITVPVATYTPRGCGARAVKGPTTI